MMKKKTPIWAEKGHGKPITRRDFLAHGMIPFAASIFMPNWMKLLSPENSLAQTITSCPVANSSMIPFIQYNLSGGAGLMANYIPRDAAGNQLTNYSKMGLGGPGVPEEIEFGNVPFAGNLNGVLISQVLAGIRATSSQATRDKTAFIGVCVRSKDDSRDNPFAMNGLAHLAGLAGTKLPHLGNQDTPTGIRQSPCFASPPSPLIVKSFNDIANSLTYTETLAQLNQKQKEKLTKLVSSLNTSQSKRLMASQAGSDIQKLIDCAGVKNNQLISEGASTLSPVNDANVASVWGLNANTQPNNENFVLGSMVYNTLNGQAGSCSFDKGGYDYHGSTRAQTNAKDLEAGQAIGRILETAERMGKPVFLVVTTDGSVSSVDSTDRQAQFNSDRGSAGMMYVFMYSPSGRPSTNGFQIGHYTSAQAADDTTAVGNSAELATQAVFANWLKLNSRLDLFEKIITRGALSTEALNKVIKVG